MSQILHRRVVTSVPPSRNLEQIWSRNSSDYPTHPAAEYSYVYLSTSFTGTNRALNGDQASTQRGGTYQALTLAGAGGLIKSNTYIK